MLVTIQHVPYTQGTPWCVGKSVVASTTVPITVTNSKGVAQLTGQTQTVQAYGATAEHAASNLINQLT